ncbi:hypothetical protein G9A89_008455 [Geosiphon pyriformis]|nr:hypothetical protein G9A89_008455 [Geosiphon pyriformis]
MWTLLHNLSGNASFTLKIFSLIIVALLLITGQSIVFAQFGQEKRDLFEGKLEQHLKAFTQNFRRRVHSDKIAMNDGQAFQDGNSPPKTLLQNNETFSMLSEMARFANMAYCYSSPENRIGGEEKYAKYHLDYQSKKIVFYFHGPEIPVHEWAARTTASTEYIKTEGGYVENEWDKDAFFIMLSIFMVITQAVITFKTSNFKVYFTGHAIGGAYALLTALKIKEAFLLNSPDVAGSGLKFIAVTFGQPRIGSTVFAEYINHELEVYRVTHSNDFIPNFRSNFQSNHIFRHHEREYWITPKNCQCPDSNLDQFNLAYDVFQCPGYWSNDLNKAGENRNCNSGTDGRGTSVHFGPYFNTTFKDCREFLPSFK